ncbi:hypothetical protein ACIPRU_02000 [Streptomyces sp. NPDC090126]|uniref:hypothetical protein n=1 Tax=Streptomyces sp. NPDC090126 TaxID=3365952 RepID=UPI0037F68550
MISKVTKAVAIGALGIAAIGMTAPAASAGTSGKVNGCYSTWGKTGFSGLCTKVTRAGQFQLAAECDWESDYRSKWIWLSKGYNGRFDGDECTFKVLNSYVVYSGG